MIRSMIALALLVLPAIALGDDETRNVKVGSITLKTPTGWKQSPPKSRLRLAQFTIPAAKGDQDDAELAIFAFGGNTVKANVDRWIGQFRPAGRESKVTTGKSENGAYVIVDISGTYNKPIGPPVLGKTKPTPGSRVVAVMLSVEGDKDYFLKLSGLDKTVKAAASDLRASFGGDAETEKPFED